MGHILSSMVRKKKLRGNNSPVNGGLIGEGNPRYTQDITTFVDSREMGVSSSPIPIRSVRSSTRGTAARFPF